MSQRFGLFRWDEQLAALPGFPEHLRAHWNLTPKKQILIVRQAAEQVIAERAYWGFTPSWMQDLSRASAHARSETVASQPLFKQAFAKQRCVIPANGFFEWRGKGKQSKPFWLQQQAAELMYFAGIYTVFQVQEVSYPSVAMLTQAAAYLRRPVILTEQQAREWIDPQADLAELQALLSLPSSITLFERRVTPLVTDPEYDGIRCLAEA